MLNIWVAPVGDMNAARVISDDRKRGIRFHGWAPNGTHVLYFQDEGGDEDFHTFAVEVATREVRNLTPIKGVQAQMHGFSLDFPDTIAVGLNERDKSWHDLFLIDIRSGKRELLFENTRGAVAHRRWIASSSRGLPPRRAPRRAAARAIASTTASSSRSAWSGTRTT